MASLPANLSFFLSRLSKASLQVTLKYFLNQATTLQLEKLFALNSLQIAYVNMQKLRFFFNASTTGTCARLPPNISSLIDRM
jgi:hypothetical protein